MGKAVEEHRGDETVIRPEGREFLGLKSKPGLLALDAALTPPIVLRTRCGLDMATVSVREAIRIAILFVSNFQLRVSSDYPTNDS
ncbi:hypothetical protein VM1G_11383 [Cytospora mali]|uniref:Uncharacterized protein n=1 Tax=Cytospora mali TaxID=578113 RepID=A0A194VRS3_CYTMA|nr:hypothetical protein VM1G_11383 [Valsa mali]